MTSLADDLSQDAAHVTPRIGNQSSHLGDAALSHFVAQLCRVSRLLGFDHGALCLLTAGHRIEHDLGEVEKTFLLAAIGLLASIGQ